MNILEARVMEHGFVKKCLTEITTETAIRNKIAPNVLRERMISVPTQQRRNQCKMRKMRTVSEKRLLWK